jgi:prepilin-type N-terminal cleavage/methylation domain-containing protein
MQKDNVANKGFTLIELMIVVAIIGILAAVAITSFSKYIKESKASETANILQGIREREEAFFGEYKQYTVDLPWIPTVSVCGQATRWNIPANSPWLNLGFNPGGPTYYQYSVQSGYNAQGQLFRDFTGAPWYIWPWTGSRRPWFTVIAMGDLDCDGVQAFFYVTSFNKTIVKARGPLLTGVIDPNVF